MSAMEPLDTSTKGIAVFGSASDVGKSIVATALCRIFANRGYCVAPFKAQNMSNNSYVTIDGGEMGRAQVAQAEACRIEPHVDMNPVLIKPTTDTSSQVVVQGHAVGQMTAADYFSPTRTEKQKFVRAKTRESLARLLRRCDVVVVEGAGSCAEVNLRSRDFVNFDMAHAVDIPVLLVVDIDKGGVFAQVVGTLAVLPEDDRRRVAAVVVNKFRGDPRLFDDGVRYLEEKTGLPILGVIPYYRRIEIDAEDGLPVETVVDPKKGPPLLSERNNDNRIYMAAIRFPHISNFTDFNALARDPAVCFHFLSKVPPKSTPFQGYRAIFLPGSKNIQYDMQWMAQTGLADALLSYVNDHGGTLIGICGGYQMLGTMLMDPQGVEGTPGGSTPGLGLLETTTELHPSKTLTRTDGKFVIRHNRGDTATGQKEEEGTRMDHATIDVTGYEIHNGITTLSSEAVSEGRLQPLVKLKRRNGVALADSKDESARADDSTCWDGAMNTTGKIWGTYLHGILDEKPFRHWLLQQLDPSYTPINQQSSFEFKDLQYNKLAEHFEKSLDMTKLLEIVGLEGKDAVPPNTGSENPEVATIATSMNHVSGK